MNKTRTLVAIAAVAGFLLGDSTAIDRANRHLRKVRSSHERDVAAAFDVGWVNGAQSAQRQPMTQVILDDARKARSTILDYSQN